MISTLRWVRKTFHFFFLDLLPNSRFFASQDAKSTWGVRRQQHFPIFFCLFGPRSDFYMFSVEGENWDPTRTRYVHKTVLRREKGISPPKCGFSQNQNDKNKKKTQSPSAMQSSITDEASHASRQPRTNSTPTPAPTDNSRSDRQIQGGGRGSLREPLDLALKRNAAALETNQQGDADTASTGACVSQQQQQHLESLRSRERASSFRAPFECIDDDDGGPSSPSSRCLGDETTPIQRLA